MSFLVFLATVVKQSILFILKGKFSATVGWYQLVLPLDEGEAASLEAVRCEFSCADKNSSEHGIFPAFQTPTCWLVDVILTTQKYFLIVAQRVHSTASLTKLL